jgi:hypothetical protein
MMGLVTDGAATMDEDDDGWARRFRIASLVCSAIVVLLVVNGIVSGFLLDVGDGRATSRVGSILLQPPRPSAFLERASLVLGAFNMFSAILVLLAVLLAVMARRDGEDELALVIAEAVGWGVLVGAVLLWGVAAWWAGVRPVFQAIQFANLVGPLAAAIVAAAATWWARSERRGT